MKLLHLTSPLLRSADVVAAQRALTTNRFRDFDPGQIDGQYGPATAAATRRAQYWVGYRKGSINGVYGPDLHAILTGRKLSKLQATRRRLRLWRAKQTPIGTKALATAHTQLGIKESPPESNRVKYSAWYGITGPWCAMFVSWCLAQNGSKFHYAYCPYVLADARAGKNGLSIIKTPRAGDLVLYDWEGDGTPDHIGFVNTTPVNGQFTAIEGNTAYGNDSNGGEVMVRSRPTSQVIAFVRVAG